MFQKLSKSIGFMSPDICTQLLKNSKCRFPLAIFTHIGRETSKLRLEINSRPYVEYYSDTRY